jgi:RNA polymerase sigma factor (TIGR02999 family)
VTQLLQAWRQGDAAALERLLPLVYADLRRRASRYLARERAGHSLETADLIHEAYLRLSGAQAVDWRDRAHFFALSARLMRQVLVDRARSRSYGKRGGGRRQVTFDEALVCGELDWDMVALDEALHALAAVDERKGPGRRAALLRRADGRGDGGGAGGVAPDGPARLAALEVLAAASPQPTGGRLTDAERFQQVERLYHAALEREGDERTAFLVSACGSDEALRREVESLLGYDGAASRFAFFEEPAVVVAARQEPPATETHAPKLAAGLRLGAYEIVAPIDAGGMGEVYRARDARLGREVAVKVLTGDVPGRDRVARFEREARAAGGLNHPNVLTVHDVGTHEGAPYLVTELLTGQTLRERLQKGALPPRKAVEIAVQMTRGLAAAHEKGIVHRDVKPANVFVCQDGRVKLLDFGLAHVTAAAAGALDTRSITEPDRLTAQGTLLGTIAYMSPEQARQQDVDVRSDVFSLGTVCYEMLAGRRPFAGVTPADTLSAILHADPPAIGSAGLPAGLDRVVRRCLEKEAGERFQSARDVGFALEALGEAAGTSVEAAPRPPGRWRGLVLAAAAGAAVAALGVLALTRGPRPRSHP